MSIQYADYAIWQQAWLEAGEGERQLAYWKAKLGDGDHELAIGADRPRPDKPTRRGDGVDFAFDPEVTRRLKALSVEQKTTLFTVIAAGFALFLYRYTGCPNPHIGAAFAGRERAELQRMIGLFVNTQVLRTQLAPEWSFRRLVAEMRKTVSEAQAHQDLPFDWLVQSMRLHRSISRNPLFQVSCAHETLLESVRRSGDLSWQVLASDSRVCRFDLELTTAEDADGTLRAHLRYATDILRQIDYRGLRKSFPLSSRSRCRCAGSRHRNGGIAEHGRMPAFDRPRHEFIGAGRCARRRQLDRVAGCASC